MAFFNVLANYGQDFQDIRPLLPGYANEVGQSGHRHEGMASLESNLSAIFQLAKRLQQQGNSSASTASKSVKDLIAFHESQNRQVKEANLRKLNDFVMVLRKWLSRQGATFKGDDGINWPKTMQATVMYDSTAAKQGLTKIKIDGGKLITADGTPLDTTKMVTMQSGPGAAIYVMSVEGNIHVHSHAVGHYHHSSLLAGAPVAGAGEIKVSNGRITWLSNKSGHYKAGRDNLLQVLAVLQKKCIGLDFALTVVSEEGTGHYSSVNDFMNGQALDNTSIRTIETAFREVFALGNALLAAPPSQQQAAGSQYGSQYGSNYGGNKPASPGNNGNYGGNKPGAASPGNYGGYGGNKAGAAAMGNYGNYGSYGQSAPVAAISDVQISKCIQALASCA